MTPEEYAAQQQIITSAAVAYSLKFVGLFTKPAITVTEWIVLLQLLFPQVKRFREDSARLARQFYDSERLIHHPELPRLDMFLEPSNFDTFVKAMEPVRKKVMAADTPPAAVGDFGLQIAHEVESAGRHQIINAVQADEPVLEKLVQLKQEPVVVDRPAFKASPKPKVVVPAPKPQEPNIAPKPVQVFTPPERPVFTLASADETRPVLGWARVATGRETCAWCLVLISRGPVYQSSKSAGSKFDSDTTMQALVTDADVREWMEEWHTGCDCKVIPVFDEANWVGKDAQERALQLYLDAHDDASAWMEKYPDRVHLTGKNKGQGFTWNEEIILALRRRIERGEINSSEWSALSVAA